jgi:hypothetical protein
MTALKPASAKEVASAGDDALRAASLISCPAFLPVHNFVNIKATTCYRHKVFRLGYLLLPEAITYIHNRRNSRNKIANMNLPADVLLLICEELGNRQDFRTLFSCALTGKTFAGSALLWLYRYLGIIVSYWTSH